MRRIGVVVNPIAGMGGRVGLKGTDNKVEEARRRGAEPRAPDRAVQALEHMRQQGVEVELLAYGGVMGADECREAGYEPEVVGHPGDEDTSREDTREAVRQFVLNDVDLVLFVGGDGTAVDVAETLDELETDTPMLGVPAGVKVYSSVFAVTPRAAGRLAVSFDRTATREVNDIDEDAFRGGDVNTELKAIRPVPVGEDLQSSKQIGGGTVEQLAEAVAYDCTDEHETTFVLGPGSTLDAVKTELGFDGAPLGVDVWRDGELLAHDATESDILANLGEQNTIIVSPIGGQGFIFGRGNPQISPAVIRQSDVEVVASRKKIDDIGVLRVDTGDPELDEDLRGWQRVRVGKFERRLLKVV
ncbi:ATP-NAD kinase family protein [Halorarius litoreus]|uniref:ATP-NAD kinase family protein n=1 Tax=Halorarius litoreus TaxID=2962676 RepID=UPI0020CC8D8E|nr:ATP-NAD kinase family protein [Halorarius litoreus]